MEDVIARKIAEKFLEDTNDDKWTYKFDGCTRNKFTKKEVSVIFSLYKSNSLVPVDGPLIIIVDEDTNEARFL